MFRYIHSDHLNHYKVQQDIGVCLKNTFDLDIASPFQSHIETYYIGQILLICSSDWLKRVIRVVQ
jgi:hypothetical protein